MKQKSRFIVTLGDESFLSKILKGSRIQGKEEIREEPRIAMVGRSNVGKSSLINALLQNELAQVSKKPGKTRSIHFYFWENAKKIIADLPGYGFANATLKERDRWARFIQAYIKQDPELLLALVLLDARHGPTPLDLEALQFLGETDVPVQVIFTKTDQLKTQKERQARHKEALESIAAVGIQPDEVFWVSVKTGDGIKPLRTFLTQLKREKKAEEE
jgi:GTP-binding protein